MKRYVISALLFAIAASVFAFEPLSVGSVHAQSVTDDKDVTVTVSVSPDKEGRIWLKVRDSYPLLFSERDALLNLVRTAEKKIDIATANKTTIAYRQVIGSLSTTTAALFSVSFETQGYGLSHTVMHITCRGSSEILLFNQKDTQDFVGILGKAHSLTNEYERQVMLFR